MRLPRQCLIRLAVLLLYGMLHPSRTVAGFLYSPEQQFSRRRIGFLRPHQATKEEQEKQPKDLNKHDNRSDSRQPKKERRKMELMWCGKSYCKDAVREKVVGEHNQVLLNGPATGQVVYYWTPSSTPAYPSVLLLVKAGDDELMKVAAQAVQKLTQTSVQIYLDPTTAARLKHYHGVDDEHIHLFEATETPGFGSGSNLARLADTENNGSWDIHKKASLDSYIDSTPDLICTLGGDGLLMHAAMLFQGPVPPILSVSGGSLGFLTPFHKDEMVDAIQIALGMLHPKEPNVVLPAGGGTNNNELEVFPPNMPSYPYEPLTTNSLFGRGDRICLSIRMRLECRVLNQQGAVRARYNVLNEVVIDRGSSPYLVALECFCDDVHLTTVQADGIIFATPTGSTAYSMAAGGSVVHPAVPAILVTPICPHVLSFRSMIFPDHVILRCYVPDDARSEASVAFDGKHRQELHRGDSIEIQMSPYPVPTINRRDHSSDWLGSLKRNFNFNTRPRQQPL